MASLKFRQFLLVNLNCTCRNLSVRSIFSQNFNCNAEYRRSHESLKFGSTNKDFSFNNSLLLKKQFSTFPRLYSDSVETGKGDTGSKEHIEKLVKNNKCVVFMKGVPDQPMCGFSNAVVQILRMHGVSYDAHNILEDEALRTGIKVFSDWPTIPQVYLDGEFIGGCDIFLQMHQSGDLVDELKKVGIRSALLDQETDPKTD